MGKFSDYVDSINEQTNILRNVTTDLSGLDASKESIGNCANIISEYVYKEDVEVLPAWYPDVKSILNSAPNIEKNGKTYYPGYILLLKDLEFSTPFYKTNSSTSTAINYYRATGGDAVLCSDRCNNDITNASADNLEVGETIVHTWDTSKDIADSSGKDLYKVRWAIVYLLNKSTTATIHIQNTPTLVFISGDMNIDYNSFIGGQSNFYTLKYFEIQDITRYSKIGSTDGTNYVLQGQTSVKTMILPNVTEINQRLDTQCKVFSAPKLTSINAPFFSAAQKNGIKKMILPNTLISISQPQFMHAPRLEELILPNSLTTVPGTQFCEGSYNLKYIKFPSSIQNFTGSMSTNFLPYVEYIELYNDFNLNNFNFTGLCVKLARWLKDLCLWLKDRTGEESNKLIIGAKNLQNAQNIWLTFNPADKRDITWVDAGTEGAINIVEFITTQLNWTLS